MENENNNKDARTSHSNSIIKNHMIWSMGAGFIPVPIADLLAVGAIQLDMIRQLSKVYDIDFKESEGKAVISALTGSGLVRLGARAIKVIPVIGSAIGGMTLSVLSAGSTYAIGEVFKIHFESGGSFLDFDPSHLKKFYDEKFEKGKKMAQEIEKDEVVKHENKTAVVDIISDDELMESAPVTKVKSLVEQLESIVKMKTDGLLTVEEFNSIKGKIMAAQDKADA